MGTLVYGVQQTSMQVTESQIAALPRIPLDFLQLSSLTSATIETFLGTDVLLSIDPLAEPDVAVHPLVIAGHVGILINALALLPSRETSDGGRMVRGAFTRNSFAGNVIGFLSFLFLLAQAFRVWRVSGVLSLYLLIGGSF